MYTVRRLLRPLFALRVRVLQGPRHWGPSLANGRNSLEAAGIPTGNYASKVGMVSLKDSV